jgi:hypothetical protein
MPHRGPINIIDKSTATGEWMQATNLCPGACTYLDVVVTAPGAAIVYVVRTRDGHGEARRCASGH